MSATIESTARPRSGARSSRRISAVRSVVIPLPLADVVTVIRDIALLEPLERKARQVEIQPATPTTGSYRIVGKLFRLVAWEGEFSYDQHANGWHSEDLHPRDDGWRISGGFVVSRVDDQSCRVTHYEDYTLPQRLRWMWPLLGVYMRRSQRGEMRDLKALVLQTVAAAPRQLSGSAPGDLAEAGRAGR